MEIAASAGTQFQITSHRKARSFTTLQAPEGPLTPRNVEYLVFSEPEVLLSPPIMNSLGFNLEAYVGRIGD